MTMSEKDQTDHWPNARRPDPSGSLIAATRVFSDTWLRFSNQPDVIDRLKELLRSTDVLVAYLFLAQDPSTDRALQVFPELIVSLCQSDRGYGAARNIILTLPKTEVERCVVEDLETMVAAMPCEFTADDLTQLSDLMVEMGLLPAVKRIMAYAASQPGEEMHLLATELDGIENDELKWRLSRAERIARKQAQK